MTLGTRSTKPGLLGLVALVLVSAAWAVPGAMAQDVRSPAELRREVQRLEQENERLSGEIQALRDLVAELTTQVEALRQLQERQASQPQRGVRPTRVVPPPPPPGPASAPGEVVDPLRSPRSMFNAMRVGYVETFAEDLAGPGVDPDDVRRWVREINNEVRGRTAWLVRTELISDPEDPRAPVMVRMTILDPRTMLAIDEPLALEVPIRFRRAIRNDAREVEVRLWKLTVETQGAAIHDPLRAEAGPFNTPPFIGPFAAFGYELDWVRLVMTDAEKIKAELEALDASGESDDAGVDR